MAGNGIVEDGGAANKLQERLEDNTDTENDKYSKEGDEEAGETGGAGSEGSSSGGSADAADPRLTAAQRARMERQRLRARELHEARLVRRAHLSVPSEAGGAAGGAADSGGGFLVEEAALPARAAQAAPAPVADPALQPRCEQCRRRFAQSYLFDTFHFECCDDCRDDEDAHALLTRTEAKAEFLLKDCDLDAREPPLRCVRRRNPHRGGHDMRLYLRAQLARRALAVWGSAGALAEERARRQAGRLRARAAASGRRLRALRMDVRSSLFARPPAHHEHEFGPETHDAAADRYSRACRSCPHVEVYEKM